MQQRNGQIRVGLMGLVLLLALVPMMVGAAELPPRPDPESTSPPAGRDSKASKIVLHVEVAADETRAPSTFWSVVQWKDVQGGWHDVGGWQGTLETGYGRSWGVLPKDFGKGPFRWVVYAGPEGDLLGASEDFWLPHYGGQTVNVEISLLS